MSRSYDVALHTGTTGLALDVWDRYDLTLDMLAPGSPWTVSLWHSLNRQAEWSVMRREVRLFDRMFWSIDGATQINGRVETIETHGSRAGAMMVISGRDMSGAALDWDAEPTLRLKGLTLEDALTRLFAPLEIPVRIGASVDGTRQVQQGTRRGPRGTTTARRRQPVDLSHPKLGERVWQLAESIVRRLGYMIWCAPDAEEGLAVVVDVPAFTSTPAYTFNRIHTGGDVWTGNILDGSEAINGRDQPTQVNIYTNAVRGDSVSARQTTLVLNPALIEPAISRGYPVDPLPVQPRHVQAERARTLQAAAQEGARIVGDAMAKFRRYTCTVQGHGQGDNGALIYAVNTMAHVRDDLCTDPAGNALDEDMLIVKVAFSGSRQGGQTATLTLIPKDSIVLSPDPSP